MRSNFVPVFLIIVINLCASVSRAPSSSNEFCKASHEVLEKMEPLEIVSAGANHSAITLCDAFESTGAALRMVTQGLAKQAGMTNELIRRIKSDPKPTANCELEADFTVELAKQRSEGLMLEDKSSEEKVIEDLIEDVTPMISSFGRALTVPLDRECLSACLQKGPPEGIVSYSQDPQENRLFKCAADVCKQNAEALQAYIGMEPKRVPGQIPNFEKSTVKMKEIFREVEDAEQRLRDSDKKVLRSIDRGNYKKSLADLAAFEPAFADSTCRRMREEVVAKASKSVAQFYYYSDPSGSGFYTTETLNGVKKNIILTANHVVSRRSGSGEFEIRKNLSARAIKGISSMLPSEQVEFKIKPGYIHLGVDGAKVDSGSWFSAAMPVNELQTLPKVGQLFYLIGNLDKSNMRESKTEFTTHICRFLGYGPPVMEWNFQAVRPGGQFMYYLECPSATQHIGGMSGGPLVDTNGKAWGNLSAWGKIDHPERGVSYLAIVVPAFKVRDGKVNIGLQTPVTDPQPCYFPEAWGVKLADVHSCQLVSGN